MMTETLKPCPFCGALPVIRRALYRDAPDPRRIDYVSRVQSAARAAWQRDYPAQTFGPARTATAGTDTPFGRLTVTVWRRVWRGARGSRIAWVSEFSLDGEPITVAEIRNARLALRPTERRRQRKDQG